MSNNNFFSFTLIDVVEISILYLTFFGLLAYTRETFFLRKESEAGNQPDLYLTKENFSGDKFYTGKQLAQHLFIKNNGKVSAQITNVIVSDLKPLGIKNIELENMVVGPYEKTCLVKEPGAGFFKDHSFKLEIKYTAGLAPEIEYTKEFELKKDFAISNRYIGKSANDNKAISIGPFLDLIIKRIK